MCLRRSKELKRVIALAKAAARQHGGRHLAAQAAVAAGATDPSWRVKVYPVTLSHHEPA